MSKATSIKEAIQKFEKERQVVAAAAAKVLWCTLAAYTRFSSGSRTSAPQVELLAQRPPIERMDASLSSLKACTRVRAPPASTHRGLLLLGGHLGCGGGNGVRARRHLSLSTNNIEKITNLAGLDNLQILSLGRNQIKKLENLDPLADTLLELWVSYNLLERLARPLCERRVRCHPLPARGQQCLLLTCWAPSCAELRAARAAGPTKRSTAHGGCRAPGHGVAAALPGARGAGACATDAQ
jgi:hypothetical protein